MTYPYEAEASAALWKRGQEVTPGGVNSPVRAFRAVGGTPRFIASGSAATLVDADGREYVDLVNSWGALPLGHAHPAVVDAVRTAAGRGTSFGAPTEGEVRLAEEITDRMPGVEQVRLVSSGTEATMSAVRLARGCTGRPVIVKFAGCYHGHADALLAEAGSGLLTLGLPGSSVADTEVVPYGDYAALRRLFDARGDRIACVIAEPAPANMGVVPPPRGFNGALANLCHEHGALLVLDEVITGFRVSRGGWTGLEGLRPDLVTMGKAMGGGLPAAAFGGRAELMSRLAPEGPVYQAGTLSGNPLATAAGLATLAELTPAVYDHLDHIADTLGALVSDELDRAGVAHRLQRAGSLFSVFFTATPVVDQDTARTQDTARYAAFFHAMLARGIYLPPSAYEAWFVSAATDDRVLDRVAAALPAAAAAAARTEARQ